MGVDALVIRHHASGAPWQASRWIDAHVLNAGDGTHEASHAGVTRCLYNPTASSALGPRCGELRRPDRGDRRRHHPLASRTQRNVLLLTTLGAQGDSRRAADAAAAGHGQLAGSRLVPTSTRCCRHADVVMMLRVQRERMSGGYFPTAREYTIGYGLTRPRLEAMKPGAAICHPGPMNRGLEISADAARRRQLFDLGPGCGRRSRYG